MPEERKYVIYIAGPISGTTNYMERFKKAEEFIRALNSVPINPTIISKSLLDAGAEYVRFMSVTRELLKCCDGIYLLNGWEYSMGAMAELRFALANDYEIFTENTIGKTQNTKMSAIPKPHGRLIDADKLVKEFEPLTELPIGEQLLCVDTIIRHINASETIAEAEDET